jgi:hypothetical protein
MELEPPVVWRLPGVFRVRAASSSPGRLCRELECHEGRSDPWARQLADFDLLSVRDEHSRDIVAATLGREPQLVIDPCLAYPPRAESARWAGPEPRFLLIYGHNFSDSFARHVTAWARKHSLPTVSIGYRNDWADRQWITADPEEFSAAMSAADAIATNFFHGCVFSLNAKKPFACESSPYRRRKIQELLKLLRAEDRLLDESPSADRFESALNQPPDEGVSRRTVELRGSARAFLQRAIHGRRHDPI